MFLPTHLINYKNHYYYQAKVPIDLKQYFNRTFIKKPLKTKSLRQAKIMLVTIEYNVHRCFTLIRTGMLSDDIICGIVDELCQKRKNVKLAGKRLSELIDEYEKEKESDWTYKTKLEVTGFTFKIGIRGNTF